MPGYSMNNPKKEMDSQMTARNLRIGTFLIAAIGFLDALYLSWVKVAHTELFCGGSSNCSTVNSSRYAEIYGIPIAFLGLGAFIVILVLIWLEERNDSWKALFPLVIFGMSLIGTLYSIYLTYIEIAVIKAICPYCVISAVMMLFLLVVSILRLARPGPISTH
jgi:uncharacterized membrane protein